MKYALIVNNKVEQVQPNSKDGFVKVEDNVVCGMVLNNGVYENPVIEPRLPSKEELLNVLIVTISTGKRFYADAESRTDLLSAILEAQNQGATDASVSNWKTPDGIVSVNLAELKEASKKALEAKAGIIGVS